MGAPVLQIGLMLCFLVSFSDPQLPFANLEQPLIGETINFVNDLIRRPWTRTSIRRDCRMLSRTELQRIFDAMDRAKRDTRLQPNVLDAFSFLHSHPEINAGAHGGTAFLPFHRYYLHLFEKLLRTYDSRVSMCYWDTTMDPENFEQSAMWTSDIFGTPRGLVSEGFSNNWLTPQGPLFREVGLSDRGRTLKPHDIENVMNKTRLGEISFPNGKLSENIEELHNDVHLYVGGLMGQIETASYDPIFWFHHTFVDCLYEDFRQKQNDFRQKQNDTSDLKIDPEHDWPLDFGSDDNAPFGPMRLGALRNIDGANNYFSSIMRCEHVSRCRRDRDCGRYMNCDRETRRCISNTRRSTQNRGSFFRGLFEMGVNSFGGMFQDGLFSPQNSGGFPGFNPMSFSTGNQGFGFGNNQGGMPGGPQGIPGSAGGQGMPQGMPQFSGMNGFGGNQRPFAGMQGPTNMQGFPGMQGMQGMQGGFGNQGAQGPRGMPGFGGMPNMGNQGSGLQSTMGGGLGGGMPNFGGGMPNFGTQGMTMPNFGGFGGATNQGNGMNFPGMPNMGGTGGGTGGFNFGK